MSLYWIADPLLLLINILAAYRLTRLWTRDSLPPLPKVRQTLQQKLGDNPLVELTDCAWCAGWWIALGTTLIASTGSWWLWVATPLAMSAVIGLLAARDDD